MTLNVKDLQLLLVESLAGHFCSGFHFSLGSRVEFFGGAFLEISLGSLASLMSGAC